MKLGVACIIQVRRDPTMCSNFNAKANKVQAKKWSTTRETSGQTTTKIVMAIQTYSSMTTLMGRSRKVLSGAVAIRTAFIRAVSRRDMYLIRTAAV